MKITPEGCAALYDALRAQYPFSGWKLPESDEVEFHVIRSRRVYGMYHYGDDHAITVSEAIVGHWETLSQTIAHEMIHLYQSIRNTQTRTEHNAEFKGLASLVCRELGFDERCF